MDTVNRRNSTTVHAVRPSVDGWLATECGCSCSELFWHHATSPDGKAVTCQLCLEAMAMDHAEDEIDRYRANNWARAIAAAARMARFIDALDDGYDTVESYRNPQ